jgi:FkbM family methyltransferase
MSDITKSQIFQDAHVIDYYKGKKSGYFIDIGANDGVSFSNTLRLEYEYQWTGVCFEPLKPEFERLISIRKARCINKAVYNVSDKTLTFSVNSLLSGISDHLSDKYDSSNWQKVEVQTITLLEALDSINAPRFIEYASIDTEGSEQEVLNGMDFTKYIIGYITIEHNYEKERRLAMREYLCSRGYFYKTPNFFDDEYIHKSLIEGVYYKDGNRSIPIVLKIDDGSDATVIRIKSPYYLNGNEDEGQMCGQHMTIQWFIMNIRAKIYYDSIILENGVIWHR